MASTAKKVKLPSFPSFKKKKHHQHHQQQHNQDKEEEEKEEDMQSMPMTDITSSSSSEVVPLMDLSDDLLLNVLTFLADVPFEGVDMDFRSTLTHTLPCINHRIHALCQQDFLWRMALLRLLKCEAYLWEEGIKRVFKKCRTQSRCMDANSSSSSSSKKKKQKMTSQSEAEEKEETKMKSSTSEEKLIDDALQQMLSLSQLQQQLQQSQQAQSNTAPKNNRFQHASSSSSSSSLSSSQRIIVNKEHPHLSLFKQTVSTHIKQTHPIFYMPGTVQLGRVFGLHFFEPRYRLLISEVMSTYPVGFRRGEAITTSSSSDDDENSGDDNNEGRFPEFIYGHVSPLAPTSPACIVQVRQCHIYPDGTADVLLMPSAYVWMERIWERPNSGGLAYGRVVRMGTKASRALERSFWATGIGSRFSPGGGGGDITWGEEDAEEGDEDGEGEVIIGDNGGDGVRGSIHAILAYLTAREQGMQEFQNAEEEEEEDQE